MISSRTILLKDILPILQGGSTEPSPAQEYSLLQVFFNPFIYGVTDRSNRAVTVAGGLF